ncbi:MAG: SET domain-containing protein-lysine N-methyltransferase [Rhizobiaceae bacterium]
MVYAWFSPKVEKRVSAIEGRGLFAVEPIAGGEMVVVKGGHLFDRRTRDELEPVLGPAEIQIDDDLFIGPMRIEDRETAMMHLNHCCEPNVGVNGQIAFFAMRDIAAGEELAMDYATFDNDDWTMQCNCGAAACRGTVTGQDWRKPELQERYAGWFSLYLQKKIAARTE